MIPNPEVPSLQTRPEYRAAWHLLCAALMLVAPSASPQEAPLPLIDTHAHLNFTGLRRNDVSMDFPAAVEGAVARMDKYGFASILLMPQPSTPEANNKWELERLDFALKQYPGRVLRGGGGGSLNPMIQETPPAAVTEAVRARFRAQAERIADQGALVFGEVTAHHLSMKAMGPQHGYESVPADHPLLLLLADIAAERGIPIDLHIDLVPEDMARPDLPIFNDRTPRELKENMAAFERLLAHNPKTVFIWAHAGTDPLRTRTVVLQRSLLQKYPNLYMSLRLAQRGPHPVIALGGEGFKPVWIALFKEFPDRFVLGSDHFHGPLEGASRGPEEAALENYQAALARLPRFIAEAIGFRNARRIFRLPAPPQ